MARLFVTVWPPENVIEYLRSVPRKPRHGVRFVRPEDWHITLRFLGEADPDAVAAALDHARLPAAEVVLGPALDVLHERSLVLPVQGVDALAAAVTDATRRLGEPARGRFVGQPASGVTYRRWHPPWECSLPPSSQSTRSHSSRASSAPTVRTTRPSASGRCRPIRSPSTNRGIGITVTR